MVKKAGILIILIIVLLLAVVLLIGYIGYNKYSQYQQGKDFNVFQQGAQAGYEQAIIQIIQQASTCQQVPLFIRNQTINIVWVDCLNTG